MPLTQSPSNASGALVRRRLPDQISAGYIENLNSAISEAKPHTLTLDLTDVKRCRLFAEGRLLGLLSLADRLSIKTNVELSAPLPPTTLGTSRYWKLFLESILGFILGQLATRIVDPAGRNWKLLIIDRQSNVLQSESHKNYQGIIGSGKELAAPIVDRFGGPPTSAIVTCNNPLMFPGLFRGLLFERFGLPRLNEAVVNTLSDFVFEALQNIRDHAAIDFNNEPVGGVSFLSLRRLNLREEQLDDLIGQERTPVSKYLEALKAVIPTFHQRPDQLLEVTIADSGVGIPARMARSMTVYDRDFNLERDYLLRALTKDGTSKASSVVGCGLGLFKIMEATRNVKGLIVFRTGRLQMYRHYLGAEDDWPSLNLHDWDVGKIKLIGGTCISLIMPWMEVGQLALDLR